ncbi:MAG: trigger factor [Treponema sp.]|nr:trigger factor [Treponema sp.]
MALSKELERLEKSSVKLTVTVGKDDVRSQYDDLLKDYTKNVQIPGFRRGKVPREVLIRKFGEALKGEALGRIIEKSLTEIFTDEVSTREERPLPYSTPRLQDEPKLDPDQELKFSVVYDVLPTVTIGGWKGLEAEAPEASISDEDLDRELEAIRERNAVVLDRDAGAAAEKGNVVTVDYCERDDEGNVVPSSEREDFAFTLGSGYNFYHFDDEIMGIKKGETKDFDKTYPEDFSDKHLAGKTKKLRVTLTELKEKQVPELDDDLAQDVDEKYKTLDDLKNSIRERLNRSLERQLRTMKINALLEKIMENTPVDIPESMIRAELDGRWRNLARRFGVDANELSANMAKSGDGKGKESIQEGWRADVTRALHSRLIVETLIEQEKLEAGDDEVEKEFERIAEETGSPVEEIEKYYQDNTMKEYLKEDIKEHKLFDVLLAENTLKPGKKMNYLDLLGNNG